MNMYITLCIYTKKKMNLNMDMVMDVEMEI